ncbi:MAG: zinc-ribbon domain-containing protein, partial [bacterium]
ITSSVNFADHKQAIRNYLEKAGADSSLIEAGIAEAEKESLILSNPFSGVTVMGIPVAAEKPAEPADAGTPINNFCMNCGAKLSENAAVCSQCGTAVPDSW